MRRALLLAALVLAVPGCSRCGRAAGPAPELARVLPRDAELLVLVPDLGALGDRLTLLEQLKLASFAAQLQGAASASELNLHAWSGNARHRGRSIRPEGPCSVEMRCPT